MKKIPLLGALAACLFAVPATAKVVEQEDDAFVTRDSVVVAAAPREVWLALISPEKWWNKAHTFSGDSANLSLMPKAGGCFCERIPAEDSETVIGLEGSVEHMRVILSMPDQALRMRGNLGPLQSEPVNAVLTITMAKADEGTQITFEYAVGGYMRYEVPMISKAVDGVISQQMMGLAELLGPVDASDNADKANDADKAEDDADTSDGETAAEAEESEGGEPKISVDEAFGDLTGDK